MDSNTKLDIATAIFFVMIFKAMYHAAKIVISMLFLLVKR